MSYCSNCGAYMPDWADACPACGASGAEPKKRAKSAGASAGVKQKAQASGEYHYTYKKAGRAEKTEDASSAASRGARDKGTFTYESRQKQTAGGEFYYDEERRRRDTEFYARQYKADAKENRLLAALCYLGPFFLLSWLVKPKSRFVRYHVNQGLVLFLCWIVINLFDFIPFMWVLNIIGIVCFFCGVSNALKGRRKPMPVIGEIMLIK